MEGRERERNREREDKKKKEEKRKKKEETTQEGGKVIGSEVIFLFHCPASDKCVCSSVSRGVLNQEQPLKHNEFCGGELISSASV